MVVSGPRPGLRSGDPLEVRPALEQLGNDIPVRGVALLYHLHRLANAAAQVDFDARYLLLQDLRP